MPKIDHHKLFCHFRRKNIAGEDRVADVTSDNNERRDFLIDSMGGWP